MRQGVEKQGAKSSPCASEVVGFHPVNLTVRQRRGVAALLVCGTHEQAASAIGVSPRTLLRWRRSEPFKEALRAAYLESIQQSITAAQFASDEAVQTLREIQRDPAQPAGARIAAAKYLDQRHWRLVQFGELLSDLAEIKNLIEQRGELEADGF